MAEYIERMAVISAIKKYEIENCPEYMQDWVTKLKEAVLGDITDIVLELSAEDVAPVVHGQWESFTTSAYIGLDEYGESKWAERRFFVHKKCGRRSAIREPYCPSCGAKMEEA